MTSNYNMGYRYGASSSTLPNLHMMSFQSGAMNTCNPVGIPSGQPNMVGTSSHVVRTGDPGPSNVLPVAVSGLKWNQGLSQVWTDAEDERLIEGLLKLANESPISKYIKIAATLNNKNVRDVALRCRWLTEKKKVNRRRPEDHVKKSKDRKEKVIASQANANMTPYNKATLNEAQVIDDVTQQLLDQNNRIIQSISCNSENTQSFGFPQMKHNAALLGLLAKNIITIQQRMSQMSGMMRCMPPLPASLDVEAIMFLQTIANMNSQNDGLASDQMRRQGGGGGY